MTLLAGLFTGLAVYALMKREWSLEAVGWTSLGLWPGWILHPEAVTALCLGVLNAMILLPHWHLPPNPAKLRRNRWLLVRFWRVVSFFLTAGMTFWQAIDQAILAVPELDGSMRSLTHALVRSRTEQPAMEAFRSQYPGPEGDLIATMVVHGYRHGITPEDAMKQAWDMEEHLSLEDALRKQSDPILLTILPALLLLNVLGVFIAPMGLLAVHSWSGFGA